MNLYNLLKVSGDLIPGNINTDELDMGAVYFFLKIVALVILAITISFMIYFYVKDLTAKKVKQFILIIIVTILLAMVIFSLINHSEQDYENANQIIQILNNT